MPKPKGGLGRGLNSLFPAGRQEAEQQPAAPSQVSPQGTLPGLEPEPTAKPPDRAVEPVPSPTGLLHVPIDNIFPNPHQPRDRFEETGLEELSASIRQHGIIQPLVVTALDRPDHYSLIAGERRLRASRLAGLTQVPVIVKEATTREMLELALVENLQRADLNPLEEAVAYRSLMDEFGLRQEDVAMRVGKSRGAVTNSLRLLKLPPALQEALASGDISEGHARALMQVPELEAQLILAGRIVTEGLSVRQVEREARRLSEQPGPGEQDEGHDSGGEQQGLFDPVAALEDQFREALGTRVQLSKSRRGGRLVIYFYSDEELDRIYGAIVHDEADS